MTVPLPWSFGREEPAGVYLENRLQEQFDALAQQFPVGSANLANDVLRLNTTGTSRKVAFGTAAIPWPGAAALSNAVTVAHGLGTTPIMFVMFMVDQTGSGKCFAIGNNMDATNIVGYFQTQSGFTPAAGNNGTAGWLAIA